MIAVSHTLAEGTVEIGTVQEQSWQEQIIAGYCQKITAEQLRANVSKIAPL